MKVAIDQTGKLIYAKTGTPMETQANYYCPKCHQPVQCCQKKNGTYYFRHIAKVKHEGESTAHRLGKQALYNAIQQQGIMAELELYETTIDQRPDIQLWWQEQEWAIEYQCSIISIDEMMQRTEHLESLSKCVWWILGEQFLEKNLCDLTLYCLRYHRQLGNFICFYANHTMTIHHHVHLSKEKRRYHFQRTQIPLEQVDWRKMLSLFSQSTAIVPEQEEGEAWSVAELQLLMMNVQGETRTFLTELYHEGVIVYALPSYLTKRPKYAWSFKTPNFIWRGYLWLAITKTRESLIWTTNDAYEYLQRLSHEKKLRFSTCYQAEAVAKKDIRHWLEEMAHYGTLEQVSEDQWRRKKLGCKN